MRTLAIAAVGVALTGCTCCRPRCDEPVAVAVAPPPAAVPMPALVPSPPAVGVARTPDGPQVLLEGTWLLLSVEEASNTMLADLEPGRRGASRVVSAQRADEIVKDLTSHAGAVVLQNPSIVTQAGQDASVWVGETATPDVERDAWIGYRVDATATVKDDDVIALSVEAQWRGLWEEDSVKGPLRASKSRRARLIGKADVAPGEALLLATQKRVDTAEGPSIFVLILKPIVIREPRSTRSPKPSRGL